MIIGLEKKHMLLSPFAAFVQELLHAAREGKDKIYVFHDNDLDGWMSAAALYCLFQFFGKKVKGVFVPICHRDPEKHKEIMKKIHPEDTIVVLDHAADRKVWPDVFEHSGHVFWVDHHPSDITEMDQDEIDATIRKNHFFLIDPKSSTAGLMNELIRKAESKFNYLKNDGPAQTLVYFLKLANLHDLYLYDNEDISKIDRTRARHLASGFYGNSAYRERMEEHFKISFGATDPGWATQLMFEMVQEGEVLYNADMNTSNQIAKLASFHRLKFAWQPDFEHNFRLGTVFHSNLGSLIGEQLLKTNENIDVAVIVTSVGQDRLSVSMRSRNDEAQIIAKNFGGGGHPKAAGFRVSLMEFHERFLSKLSKID